MTRRPAAFDFALVHSTGILGIGMRGLHQHLLRQREGGHWACTEAGATRDGRRARESGRAPARRAARFGNAPAKRHPGHATGPFGGSQPSV